MKKVGSYGGSGSSLTGNGGGWVKKKRFYIEEGSNLFRLLPPFGSLAETGAIAKYYENYWLKNSAGKPFPVLSQLKMNRDKVILQRDPIYDAIKIKEQELAQLIDAKADAALIDAVKQDLEGLKLDKAFYANVINPAGEIGTLKIKITAWNSLKIRLKELEQKGIDPINVGKGNGIIFDFKRYKDDQGKTIYTVDIATTTKKDPNTGRAFEEMQYLELDEAVFTRMEKEAEDLTKIYRVFTPEEQALLASFDPKTVDRVMQRPTKEPENVAGETAGPEYQDPNETTFTAPAKTAATTTQAPAAPVVNTNTNMAAETKTEVKQPDPAPTAPAYTGPAGSTNDKVKAFLASRKTATPTT
jgi:hypothetical protein